MKRRAVRGIGRGLAGLNGDTIKVLVTNDIEGNSEERPEVIVRLRTNPALPDAHEVFDKCV